MPGFVPRPPRVGPILHTLPHGETLDAAGDASAMQQLHDKIANTCEESERQWSRAGAFGSVGRAKSRQIFSRV